MRLLYNIDFDIAALAFMALTYILMRINYVQNTEQSKRFQGLIIVVAIATTLDIFTAYTISYAAVVPIWLNLLLNSLYFFFSTFMSLKYVHYIAFFTNKGRLTGKGMVFNAALLVAFAVFLIVNLFTGVMFSFTESGEYVHGVTYLMGIIVPLYYIFYAGLVLALNWKTFNRKIKSCIAFFLVLAEIGPILQVFWLPEQLLSLFTPAMAILIMVFSLETPDYRALMQTMDELKETKEVAEQSKAEAVKANKVKSEFLANMSHELRTPINSIIGNSRFIINETRESGTLEYAAYVEASGKTLIAIVNDILDYTAIEAGKLTLHEEPYSLLSVIRDIQMFAEYNAKQKGLEVRFSVEENLPRTLLGDSARLMQILFNLISNALKYTEEGWVQITVSWKSVSEAEGVLGIRVSDTGIGMTEEQMRQVMESFVQGGSHNQGVGLGLTIVTRLLDRMGSELHIESETGKGSVFSFELEMEAPDATPIGEIDLTAETAFLENGQESGLHAPGARILAVDDYPMNLDLLRGMLRDTSIEVDTATNGRDALELLKKNTYHVLLLDHMMPDMDGVAILQEIRKQGLCQGVPIIVITANAVAGSREQYLEEGFDDFISKPIIVSRLMAMLRKYLPINLILENTAVLPEGSKTAAKENGEQTFLDRISFLDTETGLTYCAGEEEFYQEMLVSYLNNDKRQDVKEAFEKENIDGYRILVHALKSTSLTIGAVEVSEKAKALEMAAKNQDWDFVQKNHEELLKQYETLLERIDKVINRQEEPGETSVKNGEAKEFHILMVDDDAMNLAIGERMLAGRFQLTCAKSGAETLELLEEMTPDLILLDIHMPDMSGFEVMEQLQKKEVLKEIPVVFLTADNDRDVEVKGLKAGAKEFIRKPFVADVMIERVSRLLEFERLKKYLNREVEKRTQESTKRQQQVERMSRQIVEALTKTVDAKDKYTNGHSERVALYSREIARRIGMSEEEQENIYIAGLLHDIGKIGIPGSIINKPNRLTDEEYAIIKTHPTIGAEILEGITELPGIAIGANYHHERYDGRGYPDGLSGKDIPEYGRIIGVADAYDAMTSRRSYRDPQNMAYVLGEIEKGKGTQFDPEFAEIMIQIIKENGYA